MMKRSVDKKQVFKKAVNLLLPKDLQNYINLQPEKLSFLATIAAKLLLSRTNCAPAVLNLWQHHFHFLQCHSNNMYHFFSMPLKCHNYQFLQCHKTRGNMCHFLQCHSNVNKYHFLQCHSNVRYNICCQCHKTCDNMNHFLQCHSINMYHFSNDTQMSHISISSMSKNLWQ